MVQTLILYRLRRFTAVNNPHIINLFLPYKAAANTVYDLYLIAEMAGGDCFIDIGNASCNGLRTGLGCYG